MSFADTLRNEVNDRKNEIIANRFAPNKEALLNTIAAGIKRLGYVQIDTSGCNTGTMEGCQLGVHRGEVEAFADFVTAEGFVVSRRWWGYSADGEPDILKIRL